LQFPALALSGRKTIVHIAFGGLVALINLIIAGAVLAIVGALATIILLFTPERRHAFTTGGLTLAIVLIGALIYTGGPRLPLKNYTIDLRIPADLSFSGFPGGKVTDFGSHADHYIQGNLLLNITLPDGKVIAGSSEKISAHVKADRIESLSVTYSPSDTTYPYSYWEEGGMPGESNPERFIVNRGGYSVSVSTGHNGKYGLRFEWPPDPSYTYREIRKP
jgi:hypothetical protein